MGTLEHPFLERDALLAQLARSARAASEGLGHLVLVTGEAGAGKTTLLRAFEAQIDHTCVLHGACEDLSIAEPLGPLYDLSRAAGIDLDALLRTERERLAVFGSFLDRLEAPGRASVLMIEDLHWADEATLDFIRFAARRLHDRRLLLVLTARDGESEGRPQIRRALGGVSPADVTRIALQPLSEAAVAQLAAGSDWPAQELYRVTGGNAFYVTELLRGGGADGLRGVQDALLERIGRLPAEAKALIEAVSVFPRRAERAWALDAAGIGDGEDAIDAAMAAELIEDTGTHLAFRHEIARQAVETALRPRRRRRLNAEVLSAMQAAGGAPIARLLHHARGAGDREPMARLAPLAGREAVAAGAHRQAAEYLSLAVELADEDATSDFAALLWDAGVACHTVARLRDALAFFERALALIDRARDTLAAGRILQRISRLHWQMGRKAVARAVGDEAIAILADSATPERAMALANRAQIAMADAETELSDDLCRQALSLARRLGEDEIVAHVLGTLCMLASGTVAELRAHAAESLAISRRGRFGFTLTRTLSNSGVIHFYFFLDYPAALDLYEQSIATSYELEVFQQTDFARAFRVHVLDRAGRWDEAVAESDALIAEQGEQSSPAIMARLTVARVAMRRGAPVDDRMLAEIVTLLGEEEDVRHVMDVACLFAELACLGLEARETAQAWIDRALTMPCPPVFREELFDWQRRIDPERPLGPLDGVHAPYLASFAGDWRVAAEEWARIGDPYREALALAEGDAEAVAQAMKILQKLNAAAALEHARATAHDRGIDVSAPPRRRAATLDNPAGLTQRQLDVLRLLNEGLSNAEIGARLFISPKTVDHHVSAILAQLEVATRGEAAARARDAGWLAQARPLATQAD
ncbi:AAA family ATPase [Pararhodobacter sp. SW119]|uniref:ATP-binding protein n=1 Tax=Pararhodobacter sp. SW119 TaxID=2780075 RepID=UPI001ADFF20E|nr:AAA family ATPase [Pararhodobacter sp. SW119]